MNAILKQSKNLALALALLATASCSTPKISYFQDMTYGEAMEIAQSNSITIRPDDKLSIVVNSKDPLLANMFNLPIVSYRVGSVQQSSFSSNQQVSLYTVDQDGEIDFPVLGKVKVEGLSRQEVAKNIKQELLARQLVNDPVVTVEFSNLFFTVLGEVNKPGRYNIEREKVTLLDALGMAGDMTIYGKRDNVTLIRSNGDKQVSYNIDITSIQSLYNSPVFYMQQNDVIYVQPTDIRARQSTVNGNNVRSTSFWVSIASLLTSVAVLIFK